MLLNYTSSEVHYLFVKYCNNCSEDRIISPQTLFHLPVSIERNTVVNLCHEHLQVSSKKNLIPG